jgi:YggT family protein
MNEIWWVIQSIAGLLASACLLRAWGHKVQLLQRDMLMHFVCTVTDWLVLPLRKVLPLKPRGFDFASLLGAVIIAFLAMVLYTVIVASGSQSNVGSLVNPIAIVIQALAWLAKNALYLAMFVILAQAILSWVNPNAPVAPSLNLLSRPLLAPFRRVIPIIGGIDFSPLALVLLIQVLLSLLGRVLTV